LLELFRSLAAQGKCLLVSSHELEALEKLTEHVAIMARGRIAAVGTLTQIRDLLDDYPTAVRLDVDRPRDLALRLVGVDGVLAVEMDDEGLVVRANHPLKFFPALGRLIVEEELAVSRMEPLDDSAHAILGYLLGGSGKT
jgi:ABC-2 type transport system ATP-binding protein